MLLALTDEPSEERENAVIGINSVAGSLKDLVIIFNNISDDIKAAAALESMGVIMDNIINRKKKNEEE